MPASSGKHIKKHAGRLRSPGVALPFLAALLFAGAMLSGPAKAHPAGPEAQPHSESHSHPYGHLHTLPEHRLSPSDFQGAPNDLVLWGELAKAGITRKAGRHRVTFLTSVLVLDGKIVSLIGFMAPVHPGEREKQFLLSDTRFLCNTCQSAPTPQSIVEVNSLQALPVHERPITVRGRLELLHDDRHGLLYRLQDARMITRQ